VNAFIYGPNFLYCIKGFGIEFIDLAEELEKILNRKVDLVSKNGVKPKYFDEIQKDLIYV
jgi:predicted nucleotidyltransferase